MTNSGKRQPNYFRPGDVWFLAALGIVVSLAGAAVHVRAIGGEGALEFLKAFAAFGVIVGVSAGLSVGKKIDRAHAESIVPVIVAILSAFFIGTLMMAVMWSP